jgi:hypothetical protein
MAVDYVFYVTKRLALRKMLLECDKIPGVERFESKTQLLRIAEDAALAAEDMGMLRDLAIWQQKVTDENHKYNLENGLVQALPPAEEIK